MDTDLQNYSDTIKVCRFLSDGIESKTIHFDDTGHKIDKKRIIENLLFFTKFEKDGTKLWSELVEKGSFEKIKIPKSILFTCYECGEEVGFETDGKTFTLFDKCPYPGGVPAFTFELNVPSGKMVVGNDFRDKFVVMGDYNINTVAGCMKTSLKYAKTGLAHAFVGNTCPGMFRIDKEHFVIGSNGSNGRNPVKHSKCVAVICTDLWWYSIADYDEFYRQYNMKPEIRKTVVCKPGVYCFTHLYHRINQDDYSSPQIFSKIDWVRDPDPIVDYFGEYMSMSFSAGQIIADMLKRDYFEGNIQKAVDYLFMVNGTSLKTHSNGWVSSGNPDIDSNIKPVEIPIFDKPFAWYPLSEYSHIANAAGIFPEYKLDNVQVTLNNSFTALAFNILRCIIIYGLDTSSFQYQNKENIDNIIILAKTCLLGLAKKYPDRVPENCKKLLET